MLDGTQSGFYALACAWVWAEPTVHQKYVEKFCLY